ncbi:hypothetical protein V8C35DRAFT_291113 [Trichoderma chlorosporum]
MPTCWPEALTFCFPVAPLCYCFFYCFFHCPASSTPLETVFKPPSSPVPMEPTASPTGRPASPVTLETVPPRPRVAAPATPPTVRPRPPTVLPRMLVANWAVPVTWSVRLPVLASFLSSEDMVYVCLFV